MPVDISQDVSMRLVIRESCSFNQCHQVNRATQDI